MISTVLHNASIIDGPVRLPYTTDVGIVDDRIALSATCAIAMRSRHVDCSGKTLVAGVHRRAFAQRRTLARATPLRWENRARRHDRNRRQLRHVGCARSTGRRCNAWSAARGTFGSACIGLRWTSFSRGRTRRRGAQRRDARWAGTTRQAIAGDSERRLESEKSLRSSASFERPANRARSVFRAV